MAHPIPEPRRTQAPVYHPVPLPGEQPHTAPPALRPDGIPEVASVQLPDGRIVTGYTLAPTQPTPVAQAPASPLAKNLALAGIGFAAACGGLILLTGFITALAQLVMNLIILVAVVAGLYVAVQVLGSGRGGTTVNCRKAVFKHNRFYG